MSALKREQDRIRGELEHIGSRIALFHGEYAEAGVELQDSLSLLGDAAAVYQRGDDETRRDATRRSSPSSTSTRTTISAPTSPALAILFDPATHGRHSPQCNVEH